MLPRLKTLRLTDDIRCRVALIRRMQQEHVPGRDPMSEVEMLKLEFANEVLRAIDTQDRDRHERLPERADAPAPFVEVSLRRKRSQLA